MFAVDISKEKDAPTGLPEDPMDAQGKPTGLLLRFVQLSVWIG